MSWNRFNVLLSSLHPDSVLSLIMQQEKEEAKKRKEEDDFTPDKLMRMF
jgi:hypothetical protein